MSKAVQVRSGPHTLTEENKRLNTIALQSIGPINDPHKISDEDLVYRFLIAHKWDVDASIEAVKSYISWREEYKTISVMNEEFPHEIPELAFCGFHGQDKLGNPVYYDKPNQSNIKTLISKFEMNTLRRWHVYTMESARSLYRLMGVDRVSVVLDLSGIGLSVLTDRNVINFLMDNAKLDQKYYPEHLRTMFIINAPGAFSWAWKAISQVLDERVKQKIHIQGKDYLKELQQYIDISQLPDEFGGTGGPLQPLKPKWVPNISNANTQSKAVVLPMSGRRGSCVQPTPRAPRTPISTPNINPSRYPQSPTRKINESVFLNAECDPQVDFSELSWDEGDNNEYTLKWFMDGQPLVTVSDTYIVKPEDIGKRIQVMVTPVELKSERTILNNLNIRIVDSYIGGTAQLICDNPTVLGSEKATWYRSRSGVYWDSLQVGEISNGLYCTADNVLQHLRCIVTCPNETEPRFDGIIRCGIHEVMANNLVKLLMQGKCYFPVIVNYMAGPTECILKLNHKGISIRRSIKGRGGSLLFKGKWKSSSRIRLEKESDLSLCVHLNTSQRVVFNVKDKESWTMITLAYRLYHAMGTPIIARDILGIPVSDNWMKGKFLSEKKEKYTKQFTYSIENFFETNSSYYTTWSGPPNPPLDPQLISRLAADVAENGAGWVAARDTLLAIMIPFRINTSNTTHKVSCNTISYDIPFQQETKVKKELTNSASLNSCFG